MKKATFLALVFVAGAIFSTAQAAAKKDKKQAVVPAAPVAMTAADSLSYAAGMAATDGLMPFLEQSYHIDTTQMASFERGLRETLGKLDTPDGKAYQAGAEIARMLVERIYPATRQRLAAADSISQAAFVEGFTAALAQNHNVFTPATAREFEQEAVQGPGRRYLEANKAKPGVKVTESGLQYRVITQGNGAVPKATDEVEVVYEGKLIDGTVFDATSRHGAQESDKFRANQVIKGWTEALTMMPVGSKWEITVPQELAYGARAAGQIPPFSTLIFTIELKGITPEKAPEAEKAPAEAAPAAGPAAKKPAPRTAKRK